MANTPKLLSIHLEIRYQIYFYMLPSVVDNLNIVKDDMDGPLKITTNLRSTCQHIDQELIQYYYSTKTFILGFSIPKYVPNRFVGGRFVGGRQSILKYIRRVQNLRLLIGDFYAFNHDSCPISQYV